MTRRADRLFRLVQLLRDGRLWTAARLARTLEVSERTIYRDVADLMASGVPIDGAAGAGYLLRSGYDLPPLMFDEAEIAALALGARMVAAWGGPAMAQGAREALSKIEAVLPDPAPVDKALARLRVPIPARDAPCGDRDRLDAIDAQIAARRKLRLDYADAVGRATRRVVQPLGLMFWGRRWTLVAWCELRDDVRMFRVDRIAGLERLDLPVEHRPDRTLAACIALVEAREGRRLPPDPLR